jgi:hypothetical protein
VYTYIHAVPTQYPIARRQTKTRTKKRNELATRRPLSRCCCPGKIRHGAASNPIHSNPIYMANLQKRKKVESEIAQHSTSDLHVRPSISHRIASWINGPASYTSNRTRPTPTHLTLTLSHTRTHATRPRRDSLTLCPLLSRRRSCRTHMLGPRCSRRG